MKRIVTIGGGSGQFVLLRALKDVRDFDLTSIVSMSDSGGSTGRLRDEYGVLPPGDILKCLIALSPYNDARHILQSRFSGNNKLKDHNAGNLLLVFLSQYLGGNFPEAIEAMGKILNIRGRVLPVTTDKATLVAELADGEFVYSESAIDIVLGQRRAIQRTFLVPHGGKLEVYPKVIKSIEKADYILLGPGDFYTSIVPNFLVPGVMKAIIKSKAKIIFILNLMTKYGETNGYKAGDFVIKLEEYLGKKIDCTLANSKLPTKNVLLKYKKEKATPVVINIKDNWEKRKLIATDLISESKIIRHDSGKLKKILQNICQ